MMSFSRAAHESDVPCFLTSLVFDATTTLDMALPSHQVVANIHFKV